MQRRTLIRARTLAAFREAVAALASEGTALEARRRAVVVPTRASAELLRQTLERRLDEDGARALVLPDLVSREDFLAALHAALPSYPRRLTRAEREVLLAKAARAASKRARMSGAPFAVRPGLVSAMLDFYDELGRRQRTVRRFARSLFDQLRGERGMDRGSEGLIHQTAFLAFAFLGYERAVAASGAIDEHVLRAQLLAHQPPLPYDHLVVAVADNPSDPRGLWPADFDLIGRLRALARIDVVMTDETHDAGFRERLEQELPGISEIRWADAPESAVIVRPDGTPDDDTLCFVSRDREEELRDVARAVRARARERGVPELVEPTAVVFHRPLPYLYLAQQVLMDARVPYQAFDALPLAAEPYASLLDLVMAVARTGGTREAAVALLRSGMLRFEVDGTPIDPREVSGLSAVLAERRATGESDTYEAEVDAFAKGRGSRASAQVGGARRAARAAAEARAELSAYRAGAPASEQVATLAAFLRRHERLPAPDDAWRDRHLRARFAVLGVLDGLSAAFAAHDDLSREHEEVTAAIHHAIEAQTFTPRRGTGGVHLVDAVAARFAAFDHTHLVGLVETDWPERSRRSIFYTSGMLKALGWPQEPDQLRAQQAAFRDLLGLASRTTTLHAFQLEGDAVVAQSPMVDAARDRPCVVQPSPQRRLIFADEVITTNALVPDALEPEAAAWLTLRQSRPALDDARYRGLVDPQPPQAYRVSRVDRYVICPFKYFAESVLGLAEERDELSGLTPIERGNLVHDLFERFYRAWNEEGRGTITPATLPEAIARFTDLTHQALARYPEADRALEETRLLGSIVAHGIAERVFELEADAGGDVVRRLLEFELKGPFTFQVGFKSHRIEIRGKADRIDVFRDGTLRVVDYKLSKLPDLDSSVQIAVYALAARQLLEKQEGRSYAIGAAMYLAFGDDRALEGRLGGAGPDATIAVETRAGEFAGYVEAIESGRFPPQPRSPGECQWCGFAGVCRKEYAVKDDEAAEPV